MTERVYWLAKDSNTTLYNAIGKTDVFNWPSVGIGEEHTRAFPEQLAADFINCFKEAKLILDPYMGSGTVAVVASKLGKEFVGIEINEKYVKSAKKRLKELPTQLFV